MLTVSLGQGCHICMLHFHLHANKCSSIDKLAAATFATTSSRCNGWMVSNIFSTVSVATEDTLFSLCVCGQLRYSNAWLEHKQLFTRSQAISLSCTFAQMAVQ